MADQLLTQLESEFCVAEASWALNLADEEAGDLYWQARTALEEAYDALHGTRVVCQRCNGSGKIDRHREIGQGICFRCRGRKTSAYRPPSLPAPPHAQ